MSACSHVKLNRSETSKLAFSNRFRLASMLVYNEEHLCVRLTFDSQADLVGHVSHLADGVGQVIVFFEEIKCAESQ